MATYGPEWFINGDFANWTTDNPDDWILTGESGVDPMVTEPVAGDSCRMFTSGSHIALRQDLLAADFGKPFRVKIDIIKAVAGSLRFRTGSTQIKPVFDSVGNNQVRFFTVDPGSQAMFLERNVSGATNDFTFTNVSCREVIPGVDGMSMALIMRSLASRKK